MTQLFSNISKHNQEKILHNLEGQTLFFKKDSQIMSNVKWEKTLCMVVSGLLQIIHIDYNGNLTIIEELEENSVFGTTLSILNSDEYDIVAKEDTKIIVIDYDNIISFTSNNYKFYNQFTINVLSIFSERIKTINERIDILTKRTIRDKLLTYFDIISKQQLSKTIILPFSLTNLATYLSVDRSAMMREIKHLKEDLLIEIVNKKIILKY